MATKIIIGNAKISGFVNLVSDDKKRIVIGTGSYKGRDDQKIFKESITVFLDDKFDGVLPTKGDYVEVNTDVNVSERKDKAGELNATMNVRFANQLVKTEAPTKREAPAAAPADAGRDI